MIGSYYRRLPADGNVQVFDSADQTRSNWNPDIQHGSPPLSLLTKVIEELVAGTPLRIGRLSLEILGAIPVSRVQVRSWVARPGARISMVAAEMVAPRPDGKDRAVACVTAWALATSDTTDVVSNRYHRWSRAKRSR